MTSTLDVINEDYKYGFTTDMPMETFAKGLNEDVIRAISAKKNEPDWMLQFRLDAYKQWQKMEEPTWADVDYDPIDYQAISYYSAPKNLPKKQSLDEVDPELLATFEKLGIPLNEQKKTRQCRRRCRL